MSSDIIGLEIAFRGPAAGEPFLEWAKNNPDDEYALWFTLFGGSQEAVDQRLRQAERTPLMVKAQVGIAALLGAAGGSGAIEEGLAHGRPVSAIFLGTFALSCLGMARYRYRHDLPEARQNTEYERQRHARASQVLASLASNH